MLCCRFIVDKEFDLEKFVELCPFTLTGADLYALASDAMLNAVKRKIQQLEAGKLVHNIKSYLLNMLVQYHLNKVACFLILANIFRHG